MSVKLLPCCNSSNVIDLYPNIKKRNRIYLGPKIHAKQKILNITLAHSEYVVEQAPGYYWLNPQQYLESESLSLYTFINGFEHPQLGYHIFLNEILKASLSKQVSDTGSWWMT